MGEWGGEGWRGVINNSTKNNTHIGVFKFERSCVCLVRRRPDVITINHSPAHFGPRCSTVQDDALSTAGHGHIWRLFVCYT